MFSSNRIEQQAMTIASPHRIPPMNEIIEITRSSIKPNPFRAENLPTIIIFIF